MRPNLLDVLHVWPIRELVISPYKTTLAITALVILPVRQFH